MTDHSSRRRLHHLNLSTPPPPWEKARRNWDLSFPTIIHSSPHRLGLVLSRLSFPSQPIFMGPQPGHRSPVEGPFISVGVLSFRPPAPDEMKHLQGNDHDFCILSSPSRQAPETQAILVSLSQDSEAIIWATETGKASTSQACGPSGLYSKMKAKPPKAPPSSLLLTWAQTGCCKPQVYAET